MVTPVPTPPVMGAMVVMIGAGTVKSISEVAVPATVVTMMEPVVAPAGTLDEIDVAVFETIKAGIPL